MYEPNARALDSFESELCALNISASDRAEIIGSVQAKAAQAAARIDAIPDPARLPLARRVQRLRLRGNEIMGAAILRDPKYEVLLELYVAHHEHRRVCVSSLCGATTVPQTTALRHIDSLERQGFLTRSDDRMDARRSWILPTGKALAAVDRFLAACDRER